MNLGAKLQMRQAQTLAMTPQLLQSIRLLQLSSVELEAYIAEEIEKNPLLARAEADDRPIAPQEASDQPVAERAVVADELETSAETLADTFDAGLENVFPDDPGRRDPVGPSVSSGSGAADGPDLLDVVLSAEVTLKDHLTAQMALLGLPIAEAGIAAVLIDALDDNGWLGSRPADIATQLKVSEAAVEAVLAKLRTLEPVGVFARDLADCLALQLAARDRLDPAMAALVDNLPLLARRDFSTLERICGVGVDDLVDMLAEIRKLDPKPGAAFAREGSETVVPDILVRAAPDGSWQIELNPDALPRVLVNRAYYDRVMPGCTTGEDRAWLADCLQSASWLERALDQRARTILKVAGEIVRQQDAFLAQGVAHLRPMSLRGLAEKVELHESTVSRVTANKFMATPRGTFELRYFFTVSIAASDGGDAHSAESVRHRIREMIEAETARTVLSDDAIVEQLQAEKIDIARRTVAKYRESMGIPSSVERRREKRAMAAAG